MRHKGATRTVEATRSLEGAKGGTCYFGAEASKPWQVKIDTPSSFLHPDEDE
jgi:hypothetical protein